MTHHIVMFRLKGTAEERRAMAEQFKAALEALPAQIDCLHSLEAHLNTNPAETFDIVLHATADSLDDVAKYSAHPAHKAAVAIIAGNIDTRACVDYEA